MSLSSGPPPPRPWYEHSVWDLPECHLRPIVQNYSGIIGIHNVPDSDWLMRNVPTARRNARKRDRIQLRIEGLSIEIQNGAMHVYGAKSMEEIHGVVFAVCALVNEGKRRLRSPEVEEVEEEEGGGETGYGRVERFWAWSNEDIKITNTMYMLRMRPSILQMAREESERWVGLRQILGLAIEVGNDQNKFPGMHARITYVTADKIWQARKHDITIVVFASGFVIVHKQKTREKMGDAFSAIMDVFYEMMPTVGAKRELATYMERHFLHDPLVIREDLEKFQRFRDRSMERTLEEDAQREIGPVVHGHHGLLPHKELWNFRKSDVNEPRKIYTGEELQLDKLDREGELFAEKFAEMVEKVSKYM